MVRDATWWHRLYWRWRLSPLSRPYYAIKTFLHLQWHARKTAIALDDCMRAMGQMNHSNKEPGILLMKESVRHDLMMRGYWSALPNGWKWRKD